MVFQVKFQRVQQPYVFSCETIRTCSRSWSCKEIIVKVLEDTSCPQWQIFSQVARTWLVFVAFILGVWMTHCFFVIRKALRRTLPSLKKVMFISTQFPKLIIYPFFPYYLLESIHQLFHTLFGIQKKSLWAAYIAFPTASPRWFAPAQAVRSAKRNDVAF